MTLRDNTTSAISLKTQFHCIICFDEFNLKDQFPVVLPCGHTHVCNICAKRLPRCMECREPIFMEAPKIISVDNLRAPLMPRSRVRNFNTNDQFNMNPSSKRERIQLPLPKNFVLIEMIEAVDRQQKADELTLHRIKNKMSATFTVDNRDGIDLSCIISGAIAVPGPCGTYAVREPEGLMVSPFHPQSVSNQDEYHELKRKTFRISQGQTVQVVDFHDGAVKLARNAGYILASHSQLVKVGGPTDRSCRLEGIVDTILNARGNDLRSALDENRRLENRLREEIDLERTQNPKYPIASDIKTKNSLKNCSEDNDQEDPQYSQHKQLDSSSSSQLLDLQNSSKEEKRTMKVNYPILGPKTMNTANENRRPFVFKAPAPNKRNHEKTETPPCHRENEDDLNFFDYGCGTGLFGKSFLNFDIGNKTRDRLRTSSKPQRKRLIDITATKNRNGDRSVPTHSCIQRRKNDQFLVQRQTTASTLPNLLDTEINFRTGMSGHRALSRGCRNNYAAPFSRSPRLMMSQHRGIGTTLAWSNHG